MHVAGKYSLGWLFAHLLYNPWSNECFVPIKFHIISWFRTLRLIPWGYMNSVPARILLNFSGFSYHRHFNPFKWCQRDIVSTTKGMWTANGSFICLPTQHIVVMYAVLQRECTAFQHKRNCSTAMLLLQVFLLLSYTYKYMLTMHP